GSVIAASSAPAMNAPRIASNLSSWLRTSSPSSNRTAARIRICELVSWRRYIRSSRRGNCPARDAANAMVSPAGTSRRGLARARSERRAWCGAPEGNPAFAAAGEQQREQHDRAELGDGARDDDEATERGVRLVRVLQHRHHDPERRPPED